MKHYLNRLFGDIKYKKTSLHHITIGKKMETIELRISAFYLLFTSGILLEVHGEFRKDTASLPQGKNLQGLPGTQNKSSPSLVLFP